ncbi:hypothetical protein [Rhizorhapis sp. SPR117]|uniref:hypothetical protein n=1 Tax=Rhizorhapis sp. SPR117 TaxID=2912611 RepID=UPI001F2DEB48|nr:hypothetical protein [Rhizorhapis sp. SPR117]
MTGPTLGQRLSKRIRNYRQSVVRKVRRIAVAALAIVAGAIIWGFITPLGGNGLLIVIGLLILSTATFATLPAVRRVKPETLAKADLKALPLQTEIWLDSQRKALPAPAVRLIDSITVRLETLTPQLQTLEQNEPAAQEIRRLLSDHLPQLVTGYQSIPETLRRQERNGRVPDTQLVEGLEVIDREIGSMTESLATGDLDKLSTHNRFLELKYREAKELGN